MKPKNRLLLSPIIAFASLANNASAVDGIKANNGTALNLTTSWVSSTPPTSGTGLMIVDSTMSSAQTAALGANLSVLGISNSSSNILTIGATTGQALTIGSSGITMTNAGGNVRMNLQSAVALSAPQTWQLNSRRITMDNTLTTGGNALNITGDSNSILALYAPGNNTYGTDVTISTGILWLGNTPNPTNTINGVNNTQNATSLFIGTLNFASMGDSGAAGSIGLNSLNLRKDTTANYTGNTATSTKGMRFDGGAGAGNRTFNVVTAGQTLTMSGIFGNFADVAATGNWIFGGAGNLTLSGEIKNYSANGVTKVDAGTLTISGGTNTYAGQTRINGGKLTIASTGNINSTSDVLIAGGEFNYNSSTALSKSVAFSGTGGTLSGSGTIIQAVNVTTGNTLAIGNSPGTMVFQNTLVLNGTTVMEIDGTVGAGLTGGHDFANLTGTGAAGVLTYGGTLTLDMGIIFGTGTYSWNLFDFASETGTFAPGGITLADKYSGTLLDADLNGVWDLTSGDNTWQFTESTGVLGLTVIPEPNVAALFGSIGTLLLLRRRRA